MVTNVTQYIQSRIDPERMIYVAELAGGRARKKNSKYVIMWNDNDHKSKQIFSTIQLLESRIRKLYTNLPGKQFAMQCPVVDRQWIG